MKNSLIVKNTRLLPSSLPPPLGGGGRTGKKLFLDISDIINKRYSTRSTGNLDDIIEEIFERSKLILAKDPPFDVESNIPHVDNVRAFSIANRSERPNTIYLYADGNLVKGSPFASYSATHK